MQLNKYTKYIKYIIIFVFILVIAIPFVNLSSVQSIDDSAYLVALGIDVGENTDELNVTFEFTMPNSSGEDASSEVAPTVINSVNAPSLDSAINLMNTYVSKEINLSHCKAIIISESLAANGISKIIYSLMNKTQIRPDTNIIVSKCLAKEFIQNTQPSLENLVAKYYEIIPVSSEYTGYIANVMIGDFFNKMSCDTCEAVAILGGINTSSNSNDISNSSFTIESTGSDKANSSSLENTGTSELMGLCVFKGDTLIGELTAKETLSHLLITNEIDSCNISIPHPYDENKFIDLFVYNKSNPKIKIEILNGSPYIKLNLQLEAKIASIDSDSNYSSQEKIDEISESANQYIKKMISEYLYKVSKEFNTDIDDFGSHALSLFLTEQDFEAYNWNEHYKDSFFDITVNTDVQSAFLLTGK